MDKCKPRGSSLSVCGAYQLFPHLQLNNESADDLSFFASGSEQAFVDAMLRITQGKIEYNYIIFLYIMFILLTQN